MATLTYLTTTHFDFGALQQLAGELAKAGITKPFIATDKGLVAAGIVDTVTGALEDGTAYTVFDENIALKFGAPDLEFIIRIWIVFVVSLIAAAVVSRMTRAPDEDRIVNLKDIAFATSTLFNTMAALTIAIFVGLYVWLW